MIYVYAIFIDNRLVYIGRSGDLTTRVRAHLHAASNPAHSLHKEINYHISTGLYPRFAILDAAVDKRVGYWLEGRYIRSNIDQLPHNSPKGRSEDDALSNIKPYTIPKVVHKKMISALVSNLQSQKERFDNKFGSLEKSDFRKKVNYRSEQIPLPPYSKGASKKILNVFLNYNAPKIRRTRSKRTIYCIYS